MKTPQSPPFKPSTPLLMDLISWITSVLPVSIAWCALFTSFYWPAQENRSVLVRLSMALLSPLTGALALIGASFILRLIFPRLKEGVYRANVNRGMFAWYLHLGLSRSAEISGLRPLIQSFYFLKYLYWRALGAQIEYGVNSSIGVSLVDLPLLSIGRGSTIAEGVHISAHVFVGDRLLLKKVKIGRNVFVGMHTIIATKTEIGDNSWIGMYNLIAEKLPPSTRITDFEKFQPVNRADKKETPAPPQPSTIKE